MPREGGATPSGTVAVVISAFVIRPLAEADVAALEERFPESGAPSSRHRERWVLQRQGAGTYLVAWRGADPVGWVFLHRPGSERATAHARRLGAGEIQDLWVPDEFRGRGYGRSLLEAVERLAHDAGWHVVGLEVTVSNPHNDVARAMYARHGYKDAGLGEFESGYYWWTESGERHWDGEPHRYLVKSLTTDPI
jgi:ribosomal protein S18 acetylase RimI-like enzyme